MKYYLTLTEKTFIGDDYCFSVVETQTTFTVSICSRSDYDDTDDPAFYLVDILEKNNGWNAEKIKELIHDDKYVFDAVRSYVDFLSLSRKSRKLNEDYKEKKALDEVRNSIEAAAATCWTLEEASKYSKIGINRLRRESMRKGCPWVLYIADKKRVVKVDAFKEWVANTTFVL